MTAIAALGISKPTRVQEAILPNLMSNPMKNIWVTSNPGGGATLAYSIAMLSRIDPEKKHTQALCLTSNYEVALQTATFIRKLSVYKGVRVGLAVKCEKGIRLSMVHCFFLII